MVASAQLNFSPEGSALWLLHPGLFVNWPGGRGGRDDQEPWGAGHSRRASSDLALSWGQGCDCPGPGLQGQG